MLLLGKARKTTWEALTRCCDNWRKMAYSFIWTSAPFERVESVGHWIDTEGVHVFQEGAGHPAGMNPKKCSGIMLGARYYDRFIPNLVAVLYALHELLCTNKLWSWSRKCQKAFEEAKRGRWCISMHMVSELWFPTSAWWERAPCCLCLSHINSKWAKLSSIWFIVYCITMGPPCFKSSTSKGGIKKRA